MRSADEVRARFHDTAVNRLLGFQLERVSDGAAELLLPLRPEFLQERGRVQGGIIAALADTAGAYAFLPGLASDEEMATIEFKISFLGSAADDGEPLRAVATMLKRGRTVGICGVDVDQGGRAVAAAILTFIFLLPDR